MIKKSLLLWCCFQGCFFICIKTTYGQQKGEQCSGNPPGVCTNLQECPSILSNLKKGNRNHVVCGYEQFDQIVCCQSAVTTSSTERISVRSNVYNNNMYSLQLQFETVIFMRNPTKNVTNMSVILLSLPVGKKSSNSEFGSSVPITIFGSSNCEFGSSVPITIFGSDSFRREFPHMALIGYEDENTVRWDCGGSIISEQFVLSAAHCLISKEFGPPKFVRLGEQDLSQTDEAEHIDLTIIETIPHPEFKHPGRYNDIGLVKLERKIEFNRAIRPACLPEKSTVPTIRAIATGWGTVEWRKNRSSNLQKVNLDMITQEECISAYANNPQLNRGIVEESQACAGLKDGEKDVCQGFSGGPLQIYHETNSCTYTIVGVTSFGLDCGSVVFTRVFAYLNWIEDIVWQNEKKS